VLATCGVPHCVLCAVVMVDLGACGGPRALYEPLRTAVHHASVSVSRRPSSGRRATRRLFWCLQWSPAVATAAAAVFVATVWVAASLALAFEAAVALQEATRVGAGGGAFFELGAGAGRCALADAHGRLQNVRCRRASCIHGGDGGGGGVGGVAPSLRTKRFHEALRWS